MRTRIPGRASRKLLAVAVVSALSLVSFLAGVTFASSSDSGLVTWVAQPGAFGYLCGTKEALIYTAGGTVYALGETQARSSGSGLCQDGLSRDQGDVKASAYLYRGDPFNNPTMCAAILGATNTQGSYYADAAPFDSISSCGFCFWTITEHSVLLYSWAPASPPEEDNSGSLCS